MSPFPSTSNLQYCLAAHFTGNNNQSQLFHLSDRFNKNIQLKEALITSIHNAKKIEVYQSYHDPSTLLYSCGKEAFKNFSNIADKAGKTFFYDLKKPYAIISGELVVIFPGKNTNDLNTLKTISNMTNDEAQLFLNQPLKEKEKQVSADGQSRRR
jgi:hypothetical protein